MISTWSAEKQKKNPTGWKYIEILRDAASGSTYVVVISILKTRLSVS